jgi:hypothetical protein
MRMCKSMRVWEYFFWDKRQNRTGIAYASCLIWLEIFIKLELLKWDHQNISYIVLGEKILIKLKTKQVKIYTVLRTLPPSANFSPMTGTGTSDILVFPIDTVEMAYKIFSLWTIMASKSGSTNIFKFDFRTVKYVW